MTLLNEGGLTRGQVGALLHTGYPAGGFGQMCGGTATGTAAITAADTLYLYPWPVSARLTVTSVFQLCVTVGAGSSVKCAVWGNDPVTGRPTGLPLFGQNAGFDTAGSTGIKSAAIASVGAGPGMLWFGSKATGTMPTMLCSVFSSAALASIMSATSAADAVRSTGAGQLQGYSVPDAYANDITAKNLTGATFTAVGGGIPIIGLGWA